MLHLVFRDWSMRIAPCAEELLGLEECVETLISVNNNLGLPEAAAGILEYSGVGQKAPLLEKLDRWGPTLDLYDGMRRRLVPMLF